MQSFCKIKKGEVNDNYSHSKVFNIPNREDLMENLFSYLNIFSAREIQILDMCENFASCDKIIDISVGFFVPSSIA